MFFLRFLKPETAVNPTSGIAVLKRFTSVRKLLIQQAGHHLKPAEGWLSSGNSDSPHPHRQSPSSCLGHSLSEPPSTPVAGAGNIQGSPLYRCQTKSFNPSRRTVFLVAPV